MKLVLFGATGMIGRAIGAEALTRGHDVVGVTRRGGTGHGGPFEIVVGNAADVHSVAWLAAGSDVVASAVGPVPGRDDDHAVLVGAARGLVGGVRQAGVSRLVVVVGAGSLRTTEGTPLVESPHFPKQWRANALAQAAALEVYRAARHVGWTYISPAALIEPGERIGRWRVGADDLLVDASGASRISIADYAAGFVDEIERPEARRARICLAY